MTGPASNLHVSAIRARRALALACAAALATAAGPRALADAGDASAAGSATLEEVTITAQKLTENAQTASAAVTALPGGALVAAGVVDLKSAQNLIPSVRFQMEGASTEIYVRGVGSTLDLPNIDPPNSFNFEGVYIPREATSVGLFDLRQLELLPGPQGTLYGRSSLGGAVHVAFERPSRELETRGVLEAGNYSMGHATVVQNVPLTDALAVRAAVDYQRRDGWLRSGADSADDIAARLSANYAPSDALQVYWWGQYADRNGRSPNLVRRGYNGGTFAGDPNAFDTSDPWDDRISPTAPTAAKQEYRNFATGAEVSVQLGDVKLTYVPGYVHLDWAADYWLENIPAFLSAKYDQITQELRVQNTGDGRWHWLGGLYAYGMTNSGDFVAGAFPLARIARNRLEGYAGFGEVTYDVSDRLRVTGGARASFDRREGAGTSPFGAPYTSAQDFDRVDWKVAVEYDVAAASMLYATVQTAYQPGTYNPFPAVPAAPAAGAAPAEQVAPAKLTAVTLGTKNRFLDGRLQVNAEAFRYDYRDLFVQSFNLNTFLLTTFNAQKVDIYGTQLDVLWKPVAAGRLNLSVGWLHARFDEFVVPAGINIGTPRRDYAGFQLQNAPDWTVTFGYQHDVPAGAGFVRARAETRYESSFWGTFQHARGTQQPAYFKTDASVTYWSRDETWSVGVWARNLENEAVLAATTTGQFGPYADAFLEAPRTYGARVTFRF
jgi:iron complex outermembrane receptor protein